MSEHHTPKRLKIILAVCVSLALLTLGACQEPPFTDGSLGGQTGSNQGQAADSNGSGSTGGASEGSSGTGSQAAGDQAAGGQQPPATSLSTYSVNSASFKAADVVITYPQLSGLADADKQAFINALVQNTIFNYTVGSSLATSNWGDFSYHIDYQVTLQTEKLISICFTGTYKSRRQAYSVNQIYSVTIDLKSARLLRLADLAGSGLELAKQVLISTSVSGPAMDKGALASRMIATARNNNTAPMIADGLQNNAGAYAFYLAPDSMMVSLPVPHIVGDYVILQVFGPYADNYRG